MGKTKKKKCINKYNVSEKGAKFIANYLFGLAKNMQNNRNNKETTTIIEVGDNKNLDIVFLKEWAELLDKASLLQLYNNLYNGKAIDKENLELLEDFIESLTIDDIEKLIKANKDSIVKYFKLWIKISKVFPYSKNSVFSFTEKYFDGLIDKIKAEETNKLSLFFTFLSVFAGFLAVIGLKIDNLWLKGVLMFVFVFSLSIFVKALVFYGKNIFRKRTLSNLANLLENEENINEDFIDFVVKLGKKAYKDMSKSSYDNLTQLEKNLTFLTLKPGVSFYFQSLTTILNEYKWELFISGTISIGYVAYNLFF